MKKKEKLQQIYLLLFSAFGDRKWWPAESPFEVCVGAILAQNTAWKNVEKAIGNLKRVGLLSPEKFLSVPLDALREMVRPSGFYNQKALRLARFMGFIKKEYEGSFEAMLSEETSKLREKLLSVRGLGPETADSILLYAAEKLSFVVDAYTIRILGRHQIIPPDSSYEEVRDLFMDSLEEDLFLYKNYHALLVHTGHHFCKRRDPLCHTCPLRVVEPIVLE